MLRKLLEFLDTNAGQALTSISREGRSCPSLMTQGYSWGCGKSMLGEVKWCDSPWPPQGRCKEAMRSRYHEHDVSPPRPGLQRNLPDSGRQRPGFCRGLSDFPAPLAFSTTGHSMLSHACVCFPAGCRHPVPLVLTLVCPCLYWCLTFLARWSLKPKAIG